MEKKNNERRLEEIRKCLKRGDVTDMARRAGVTRVWLSCVVHNRGTSEPLLQTIESYLKERFDSDFKLEREKG